MPSLRMNRAICMNGWMKEWTDGWGMNEQSLGWMDEWINEPMDGGWMHGWTECGMRRLYRLKNE